VTLHDGTRFAVASVSPEPGYGLVTLVPDPLAEDDDELPEALIVPVGSIMRFALHVAADRRGRLGFSV
jgi:hypothetical protein